MLTNYVGRILTGHGGLLSTLRLSRASVGKIPKAAGASGLGPGSSGGSFTQMSGFRAVVT